jgi:23S rRNA pseudouridine1911/1915/1917 synthase
MLELEKIKILYEDEEVLCIDKPAGLIVHPDGKRDEVSVASWVLRNFPQMKEVGEPLIINDPNSKIPIIRPGIVHRIDKDTSGVLILAKNQISFEFLKKQFQDREIEKTYHAFVYGNFEERDGIIDRPIARSRSDFRQWSAQRGARGEARDAITHYKVLVSKKEVSFLELSPKTGRTHQIRVHLKAINHPVVCDKLYASKGLPLLGFKRLALHAHKLIFKSVSGKSIEVTSPYPADFEVAKGLISKLP